MPSFRYNASVMRSTFERRIMRTHVAAATAMPSKHQEQLSRQQPRDAILPAAPSSPPSPSNRLLDSSQNTSPQLLHLGKYEATLLMDCPSQQGVVALVQACCMLKVVTFSRQISILVHTRDSSFREFASIIQNATWGTRRWPSQDWRPPLRVSPRAFT